MPGVAGGWDGLLVKATDVVLGVRLTDEQKAIMEHPLEPLRVVAGAGTGKTTTVVARVVHNVLAGMPPEAVLGLTFTNKAAEELSSRLRSALPTHAENGRDVEVTTYHGFAWMLLQEFGALVGVERDAGIIGAGYTRQLLLETLDVGRYEHLDMSAPAWRVNEAAVLARRLNDQLQPPGAVAGAAPAEHDGLWGRRLELARIVERYQSAKRRLGVVDYGDLVRSAFELVTEHPDIRARIRSRYRLLVLDEYQDTDPGQRTFLQNLFGDGFPVTAVGDEDQTIYEWRGASTANFRSFPEHFPKDDGSPAESRRLTLNRRSSEPILDVANAIRTRLRAEASLEPLRPVEAAPAGSAELRHFRTAAEEAGWIAGQVRRRHDEDGVPWREIAVLFRKNRNIALVRDGLDAEDVPLEVASLGGLLKVPQVADLHAWLRILGRPEDSAALARILLAGKYSLGLGDLAPLVEWVRREGRGLESEEGPGWPLVEAIDRLAEIDGLLPEAHTRIAEFRSVYRQLLVEAQAVSLSELSRRVLDRTDTWAEIDAYGAAARLSARLNLYRFLDLAEEWSPLRGRPSLDAFLGYLDLLVEERATDELDTARVSGEDAVALLTVHRAKGLEWDTVFVPTLARSMFPATSLGYDNPHTAPTSLPYSLRLDASSLPSLTGNERHDRDQLRQLHLAQEWRTAYVAVTRAKRHLALSGAFWYTAKKPRDPSEFYALAAELASVEETAPPGDPGESPGLMAMAQGPAPDPLFSQGWRAALRDAGRSRESMRSLTGVIPDAYDAAMDQIKLMLEDLPARPEPGEEARATDVSVTALVTLAQCPRKFEWSEVDPLPRRRSSAQTRGIELHRRIELHNRGQVPFEDLSDDLYDAPLSDQPEAAGDAFAAFLDSRYGRVRPRWTETAIDVRLETGRVRGRIDAVYQESDGAWEIVDFKSGRRGNDPARRVQLEAYAIAAADGALDPEPPDEIEVSFVYLGGGALDVEKEIVDEAWLETARGRLEELVASAKRDEYDPTPGAGCRTCDFVSFCDEGRAYLEAATRV